MYLKRLLGGAFLMAALLLSACGEGATSTSTPASATSAPAMVPTEAATATTSAAVPTTGAGATPAAATATEAAPATGTGEAAAPTPYSGPIQKVSLALDWTPNTNHTGFYVAQQKGWYKEQGIDLEILPYSDAASPDALVAAGKADFAISFVEQVVIDRVSDLPVKSVAAIVQHNTSELATLKSSGLDRPAKLAGKRYAGFGTPYEEPVIADVIKCDGGPATPIQNITTNTGGYQALVAKQADFVWIYKGWEALQAKHDNVDLNEFLVRDYCVPDYYSPVIITSEAFLKDKADVGRRFMAATARGFEFAISQPDQAADLLIAGNPPGSFPDAALVHESAQYLAKEYQAEAPRWGDQTLQVWSGYPKFMLDTGRLEDPNHQKVTSLDYAALFTNDLLPSR
jgi:ABC-type nitrate/sulfonate/bicarbonate transport system substrate-binding protein